MLLSICILTEQLKPMNSWLISYSRSSIQHCVKLLAYMRTSRSRCSEPVVNVPIMCSAAVYAASSINLMLTPSLVAQVQVTRLVEQRMLQQPSRAAAYRQYQQTTAMWFPGIFCSNI